MRNLYILSLLLLIGLTGCASNSIQSCNFDRWHEQGLTTAKTGGQPPKSENMSSCGVSAPLVYRMGYEQGLEQLCTYEQGLFEGEHGKQPSQSCRQSRWTHFQDGFMTGREIYTTNQRLERISAQLQLMRKQLSQLPAIGGTDALAEFDHDRVTTLRGEIASLASERDTERRRLTSLRRSLTSNSKNGLSSL